MLRHVLLFNWTADSKAEDRSAALTALRSLDQTVPEIRALKVEESLGLGPGSYDGMLEAEFADEDAYNRYVSAESHQRAWLDHLQPVCAGLASIQVGA